MMLSACAKHSAVVYSFFDLGKTCQTEYKFSRVRATFLVFFGQPVSFTCPSYDCLSLSLSLRGSPSSLHFIFLASVQFSCLYLFFLSLSRTCDTLFLQAVCSSDAVGAQRR